MPERWWLRSSRLKPFLQNSVCRRLAWCAVGGASTSTVSAAGRLGGFARRRWSRSCRRTA